MKKGFSLLEIIIVMAILAILGSIALNSYKPMLETGHPISAAQAYGNALREAKGRANNMLDDTAWGARVTSDSIIVFSGASYAARVSSRDKTTSIPSVQVAGPTEIVFAKFTGLPSTTGTTTFSNAYASTTVSTNTAGIINF